MLAHFLRQEFSLFYQHPLAVIIALLKGFLLVSISCPYRRSWLLFTLFAEAFTFPALLRRRSGVKVPQDARRTLRTKSTRHVNGRDSPIMDFLANISPFLGFGGLAVAWVIYKEVCNRPDGNERMREIAGYIYEGAMAFLRREYRILGYFVLIVFVLLTHQHQLADRYRICQWRALFGPRRPLRYAGSHES